MKTKKVVTLVLASMMAASSFAACTTKPTETTAGSAGGETETSDEAKEIVDFTMFAAMVNRTQSIPFKIEVDPFYSEENMERLKKAVEDLQNGKGQYHELIEVE